MEAPKDEVPELATLRQEVRTLKAFVAVKERQEAIEEAEAMHDLRRSAVMFAAALLAGLAFELITKASLPEALTPSELDS